MVKRYTVQTSNAFAALGDDSDSEDVILPLAPEAQRPAQQTSPTKPGRELVGLPAQTRESGAPAAGGNGERRPRREGERREGERRGPRPEGSGNGERRPRREPRAGGEEGVITAESERRPPRPAGRGPRQVREGKREFDRVSGTGRGTEIKREGGGSYNWGKVGEDVWNVQEAEGEQAGEVAPAAPKADQPEAPAEQVVEQQPPQPKTFTYAQYKRQLEEKLAGADEDDSAARAAELEAERQKAIKEGYTLYTKDSKGAEKEDERKDDRLKEKGGVKTMSLAEVAEQSGVSLNYGGRRPGGRGEGRGGRREGGEDRRRGGEGRGGEGRGVEGRGGEGRGGEGRGGEGRRGGSGSRGEQSQQQQQQQPQQTGGKEINLVDNQAFPTLQAH